MSASTTKVTWSDAARWSRLVLGLIAVALLSTTGIAAAHSDDGEMTVTKADAVDATTIDLEVGLLFANDDDLATEATVTATATSASAGASAGPVTLPNVGDALYGVRLEVPGPGVWTITVTSTEPAAEATVEVDTAAATSGPDQSAPTTAIVPPTTEAADRPTETTATPTTSAEDPADTSAIPPMLIGVIALVVVLVGGAAFAAIQRRERDHT